MAISWRRTQAPVSAEPASGSDRRQSRRPLWRNRDFLVLMTGEMISSAGSEMAFLVVPLVGYYLTHSYTQAALAGTASTFGGVATRLPVGALADRWSRRRILLSVDVIALVIYGALAAALAYGRLTIAELASGAFLMAIANNFFGGAMTASIRTLVPASLLPQAMSVVSARNSAAEVIGAPVGGLLYGIAKWLPFGANAISYLASLAGITLVRSPLPAPPPVPDAKPNLLREIAEGLRFLWSRGFFRAVTLSASVINFAVTALLLALTLKLLHAGVPYAEIGVVFTIGALGGLAGGTVAPALVSRVPTGRLSVIAGVMVGVMLVPLALTDNVLVAGAFLGLATFFLPACNSASVAYQMAITPDRMQARMFSAMNFGVTALMPLAPLTGGLLLTVWGGQTTLLLLATLAVAGAMTLFASKELRKLPVPDQWDLSEPWPLLPAGHGTADRDA
jgi:MFS family permease